MSLLRLTQDALADDRYRVEIAFEGAGPRRVAKAEVTFRLTGQDEEDLRWYLEDYLQWPHEPAPTIAARVVARMEPSLATRRCSSDVSPRSPRDRRRRSWTAW